MKIILKLRRFLTAYPGMSLQPVRDDGVRIAGRLDFKASGFGQVAEDSFDLDILIPWTFPRDIPRIIETAGKIPNNDEYHVNGDGTLCLGSQLRLMKVLDDNPDIVSFTELCVIPYLFNVSIKLRSGGNFVTGELAHGTIGVVHDYMEMFRLNSHDQIIYALRLLGMKKRIANKRVCPCGCGLRLGRCRLHHVLNSFRTVAPRSWFNKHASDISAHRFG